MFFNATVTTGSLTGLTRKESKLAFSNCTDIEIRDWTSTHLLPFSWSELRDNADLNPGTVGVHSTPHFADCFGSGRSGNSKSIANPILDYLTGHLMNGSRSGSIIIGLCLRKGNEIIPTF